MNYWLFSIMYDWYPESWRKLVAMGIAAQQYPPGWTNEKKNVRHLEQLKRGDKILAAFHGHRFGGYGTLTSDFYRGGPSMAIRGQNGIFEFQERADCDWTTLPLRGQPPYVELHELKKKGFDIDLTIGLCVKKIDKATFDAVRVALDQAGAKSRNVGVALAQKSTKRPGKRERAQDKIINMKRAKKDFQICTTNASWEVIKALTNGLLVTIKGFIWEVATNDEEIDALSEFLAVQILYNCVSVDVLKRIPGLYRGVCDMADRYPVAFDIE